MQESAAEKKADKSSTDQTKQRGAATKPEAEQAEDAGSPIALLKADHRKVEQLFEQFEKARSRDKRLQCVRDIARELIIHAKIEEELFYPACREALEDDQPLDEAQVEHDSVKLFLADLLSRQSEDQFFRAKVKVLKEYVKHHIQEEEESSESIFAKAKKAGLDEEELGQRLQSRKRELEQQYAGDDLEPPAPVSIEAQPNRKETGMRNEGRGQRDRYDDDRNGRGEERASRSRGRYEEDDRDGPFRDSMGRLHHADGRFMSEDEEDDYSGRGRSSSSRYDDDDRRSSRSRSRSNDDGGRDGPFRDSMGRMHYADGRFMSQDEEESSGGRRGRSSSSSSSRYDDDDRRGSRSSGGGRYADDDDGGRDGPFRDSTGRMHRADGRFMSEDEDDRRGGRDGGRNTRSEGSGRRYQNDSHYAEDRGQGGYFGDPEGHRRNAMGGGRGGGGGRYRD
jgi:hypothetical protein